MVYSLLLTAPHVKIYPFLGQESVPVQGTPPWYLINREVICLLDDPSPDMSNCLRQPR